MKILLDWLVVQIILLVTLVQEGRTQKSCRPIADVVFLIDGSDSISDDEFNQQKTLLQRFVQSSDFSPETVRVGIAVVSTDVVDAIPLLPRSNVTLLTSEISSLSQPMEGSRIDLGLIRMEQIFGTDGRPGVVRIGVVISDGRAKFARATQGEANVVKNAGVFLVAIGVGRNIQFANLEAMASTQSNAYPLQPIEISTKMLTETVKFLGQETCSGHALLDHLSTNAPHVDPIAATPTPPTHTPLAWQLIQQQQQQQQIEQQQQQQLQQKQQRLHQQQEQQLQQQQLKQLQDQQQHVHQQQQQHQHQEQQQQIHRHQQLEQVQQHHLNEQKRQIEEFRILQEQQAEQAQQQQLEQLKQQQLQQQRHFDQFHQQLQTRNTMPQNHLAPPQNAIILPQQVIGAQQITPQEQNINPQRSLFESMVDSRSSMVGNYDLASLKGVDAQSIISPYNVHSANFSFISREIAKDLARKEITGSGGAISPDSVNAASVTHIKGTIATGNGMSAGTNSFTDATAQAGQTSNTAVKVDEHGHVMSSGRAESAAHEMSSGKTELAGHGMSSGVEESVASLEASLSADMNSFQNLYDTFNMGSFKFEGEPPMGSMQSNMNTIPTLPNQLQPDAVKHQVFNEPHKPKTNNVMGKPVSITHNSNIPSQSAQSNQNIQKESHQSSGQLTDESIINMLSELGPNRNAQPLVMSQRETVLNLSKTFMDMGNAQALIDLIKQPLNKPADAQTGTQASTQHQSMATGAVKSNNPSNSVTGHKVNYQTGSSQNQGMAFSFSTNADSNAVNAAQSANAIPGQKAVDAMLKDAMRKLAGSSSAVSQGSPKTTIVSGGTTASPYIHGIHRELAAHQCSQARVIDGVGYTFHPKSCTEFLQCFNREGGELHVEVGTCPFETFFDEELAVCKHYSQVNCYRDPCSDTDVISYKHSENCRAYWDCGTGSKSKPRCCPYGSAYSPGYGCIRNTSCEDMCMDFGDLNTVVVASKCKNLAMESDPKYYFESVAGVGWVIRMCPYGSRFLQSSCECRRVAEANAMTNNCNPELYLDFQGSVEDRSGNGLSLGNTNVQVETGAGVFDGTSLLKLWRFSGVSFGQKVTVTFRFRVSVTAPKGRLMHLISNCCYGCSQVPSPSIDVAIIPGHNGGIGVFSARTEAAGEVFVYVPYEDTITGWNRLTYTYNGRELTGRINSAENRKQIIGDIEARSDPLTIGACNKDGAYQGYMDEVKFYLCDL